MKRKADSYLQRNPTRLSADFSKETLQAKRDWGEVFKVMKSKDLQPRLLYPAKLSFRTEGKIKVFPRQGKFKGVHHHQAIIIGNVKGNHIRKRSKLRTLKRQQMYNYQQLNLKANKQTKQTTRTGTES